LQEIKLNKHEIFVEDSEILKTQVGKKYELTTKVKGISGSPFSAYFGVDIIHGKNLDSDRRIAWLNDFSGKIKKITITFLAPTEAIRILYRINQETEATSPCKFGLLPLNKVSLIESKNNFEDSKNYLKSRPKELSLHDELILEKNLVWLFGSARSGSTWLGTELLQHDTHIMREPKIDLHLGFASSERKGISTVLENNQQRASYVFSFRFKNSWKYYLRKLILNRVYCQYNDLRKKVIMKEPSTGTYGFSTIQEIFPNSKIIWLLRDGRDVIDSQTDARTLGHVKGGRFENLALKSLKKLERTDFIKTMSQNWVHLIERMSKSFENHSPNLRLLIKYEELRKNPLEELRKIYKFLEIEITEIELIKIISEYNFENFPDEDKGTGKQRRSATPGKWKENFSKKKKKKTKKITGHTLRKVGYEK